MKTTLCLLILTLVMSTTMQAFACPLKGESTGGACSVKDIQNLEINQRMGRMQEKDIAKDGKNLRPVKINPEIKNLDKSQCVFCLQQGLFEKI